MRRVIFRHIVGAITAMTVLAGGAIEATYIASVKAMGMGGVAVAYGQDSITAFYNPATACCVGCRSDIGILAKYNHRVLFLSDRPTTDFQFGEFRALRNWDIYGEIGWNTRWDWCGQWAFAVQWNNYDQVHVHYPTPMSDFSGFFPDLTPAGTNLKFNYRVEVLTATAAYELCDWITLGVAANGYFSWLDIKGLEGTTDLSTDPADFTNRTTDTANGVGVTAGLLAKLCCDRIALGLSYSPRVHMTRFHKYRGFLATGSLDIPETFRAGVSFICPGICDPRTVVAVDGEYRRYSQIPSWANNFPGSTAGAFSPLFGTANGPGFGWEDQWIVKVGLAYRLNQYWAVRAGYRHEKSPIPRNGGTTTALNALTLNTIEDYVSAGFTIYPDNISELSAFAEYGFNNSISSAFPNIVGRGDATFHPATVRFQAYTVSMGLSYGLNY